MTGYPVLERTGVEAPEADLAVPTAATDPLGLLDVAGLGWLVGHVDVLREPLDWLAGHGDRFEDAVATWWQVVTTLDGIARRRAGGRLTAEIAGMSRLCQGVASHVAGARAITAAVHGVFRDVVALFVREVLANATVALAGSELTGGSSVAEFGAWAVGRGAVVLDRVTRRLADLVRVMVRILSALKALFGKARDMLKAITRLGE